MRARVGFSLAVGFGFVVACSAGSSPSGPTLGTKEPAGGGQEPGKTGEEPTGGGYQAPAGSSSGATNAGGSSGTASPCLVCGDYTCVLTGAGASSGSLSVSLGTGLNGACLLEDFGLTLTCDGQVLEATIDASAASVGTWTSTGGGGFTATGPTGTLTCTVQ